MNLMFENPNTGTNENFLYQWDNNCKMFVELKNVDTAEAVFWTDDMSEGVRVELKYSSYGYTCIVPDILTSKGVKINVSICYTNSGRKTVTPPIAVPVVKQAKPAGWVSSFEPEYINIDSAYMKALQVIDRVDTIKGEIESKGKETKDSIPDDYTALQEEVTDTKESLDLLTWTDGAYIKTSDDDVTFTPVKSTTGYGYMIVPCAEGDIFSLSGTGGSAPRLWAWINANNKVIDRSGASINEINKVLIAPVNAKYLVINSLPERRVIKLNSLPNWYKYHNYNGCIPRELMSHYFYIPDTSSGKLVKNTTGERSVTSYFLPVNEGDILYRLIPLKLDGITVRLYIYTYDKNMNIIYDGSLTQLNILGGYVIPSGVAYVRLRIHFDTGLEMTQERLMSIFSVMFLSSKLKKFCKAYEKESNANQIHVSIYNYDGEVYDQIFDDIFTGIERPLMILDKKTYYISKTLILPGGYNLGFIDGNSATIKATDDFIPKSGNKYLMSLGTGDTSIDGKPSHYDTFLYQKGMRNLILDCNGKCSGLHIVNACTCFCQDVSIAFATDTGVRIDRGVVQSMDAVFENVNIGGIDHNTPESIGLSVGGYDSTYKGIRTYNFATGIQVSGNSNTFIATHPLLSSASNRVTKDEYKAGVGYKITGSHNMFINAYSDNFIKCFDVSGNANEFTDSFCYMYMTEEGWRNIAGSDTLPTFTAISVNNNKNRFNGIHFSVPELIPTKLLSVPNIPIDHFGKFIEGIKYPPALLSQTRFLPTGYDDIFNTSYNKDSTVAVISKKDDGTIFAGEKIPLFITKRSNAEFIVETDSGKAKCILSNSGVAKNIIYGTIRDIGVETYGEYKRAYIIADGQLSYAKLSTDEDGIIPFSSYLDCVTN